MERPEHSLDLERLAAVAVRAADRAREEVLPRFRCVAVERKADGSPVTEADRAAERAIRALLAEATPGYAVLGEEYGETAGSEGSLRWLVDPIDGTIAFVRGLPLFATLVALCDGEETLVAVIDLPALGERYVGWKGGGCHADGRRVEVGGEACLERALVAHGDPFCFRNAGQLAVLERMTRELPLLRGYTDAFGHAQVIAGRVDAMVDLDLAPWDVAATRLLIAEAGGRCVDIAQPGPKTGIVIGNAALVEQLLAYFPPASPREGR